MTKYNYFNSERRFNEPGSGNMAIINENKTRMIHRRSGNHSFVSIERFYIRNAYLPVCEGDNKTWVIRYVKGAEDINESVDLSPYMDDRGLIYKYLNIVKALNAALTTLNTTAAEADKPDLQFKLLPDGKLELDGDKEGYEIYFNENLRLDLNIFNYERDGIYYELLDTISHTPIWNLYEVDKISLISNLPVNQEDLSVDEFSLDLTEGILTDFQIVDGVGLNNILNVSFIPKGERRLHNLINDVGNSFSLRFKFKMKSGKEYNLTLTKGGSLSIKILFMDED